MTFEEKKAIYRRIEADMKAIAEATPYTTNPGPDPRGKGPDEVDLVTYLSWHASVGSSVSIQRIGKWLTPEEAAAVADVHAVVVVVEKAESKVTRIERRIDCDDLEGEELAAAEAEIAEIRKAAAEAAAKLA